MVAPGLTAVPQDAGPEAGLLAAAADAAVVLDQNAAVRAGPEVANFVALNAVSLPSTGRLAVVPGKDVGVEDGGPVVEIFVPYLTRSSGPSACHCAAAAGKDANVLVDSPAVAELGVVLLAVSVPPVEVVGQVALAPGKNVFSYPGSPVVACLQFCPSDAGRAAAAAAAAAAA